MKSESENLLSELCAEIERAWTDRRDFSLVGRYAASHPELAEELYDFFSVLVPSYRNDAIPEDVARDAARQTRDFLERDGFERAAEAARQTREPWPFIKFLRERSQAEPKEIARRIGRVSWEFLVMVSRHPPLVPKSVASELVSRVAAAWKIPLEECRARFEASGPVPRAASRKQPYLPGPATFAELLERSSLGEEDRSYWLRRVS